MVTIYAESKDAKLLNLNIKASLTLHVVDGVNVPARVYRIATEVTEHGGTIEAGTEIVEIPKRKSEATTYAVANTIEYAPVQLDRSVINRNQMKTVLEAYKNALYTELYPEREECWEYIPKTLIFAKDDNHATEIVNVAKEVFGSEFKDGEVPENYVQKITYSTTYASNIPAVPAL